MEHDGPTSLTAISRLSSISFLDSPRSVYVNSVFSPDLPGLYLSHLGPPLFFARKSCLSPPRILLRLLFPFFHSISPLSLLHGFGRFTVSSLPDNWLSPASPLVTDFSGARPSFFFKLVEMSLDPTPGGVQTMVPLSVCTFSYSPAISRATLGSVILRHALFFES